MRTERVDYDQLVIGSRFGGSTSALRLAEKGYRIGVLECGRRFTDDDFAKTTWDAAKYYWMPKLGMKGIFRLTLFKDIFVASGCGVGGGSLGYANTLFRARPAFYGPARTGCIRCGRCMIGCPHGAKNTLVKNYLYFAERLGVR